MNMLNHADYYLRRERQEQALATAAIDPDIRQLHGELAERYAALAMEADETRLRSARA